MEGTWGPKLCQRQLREAHPWVRVGAGPTCSVKVMWKGGVREVTVV